MASDKEAPLLTQDSEQGSMLHVASLPIGARNTSLVVIAFVAFVYLLSWAKPVLIPIVLAISLSYLLTPAVTWLRRRARLPEPLGAAVALLTLIGLLVYAIAALQPQASSLIDTLPQATRKIESLAHRTALDQTSAFRKLNDAADQIGKAADPQPAGGQPPPPLGDDSGSSLRDLLWSGAGAVLTLFGRSVVVIALSYFLLISGKSFKRRIVKISGTRLSEKKITVHILDDIDEQIQRYLMVQVGTSALVGLFTGVAYALIGMGNPLLWGVAAGVLHLVPYVGTALVVAVAALFAYLQFDSLHTVLLVVASGLGISGAIGMLMVPWLTERVGRINAVATFVSLMIWEWLWGVPGLLLGVPIMMAVMAVSERVDRLRHVAELLGGER